MQTTRPPLAGGQSATHVAVQLLQLRPGVVVVLQQLLLMPAAGAVGEGGLLCQQGKPLRPHVRPCSIPWPGSDTWLRVRALCMPCALLTAVTMC